MSDGQLPDRVLQLRQRWASDPASRIFLQLAEEYRHLGRVQDALGVLEGGLKEHPGYLSALIAKGRCHLELGQPEAARDLLERVVKQDATQMVANKLLVRAYLETGQSERARERLDLYALLHESDPEIEELRSRIRRMEAPRMEASSSDLPAPLRPLAGPPHPAANAADDDVVEGSVASPADPDDLFGLGLPRAPLTAAGTAVGDDLFDLSYPRVETAPELPVSPSLSQPPISASPASPASPIPPATLAALPDDPDSEAEQAAGDLFPGLVSRDIRRRYLEGLAAEGLFPLQAPTPPPLPAPIALVPAEAAPALVVAPEPVAAPAPAAVPEPVAPPEPVEIPEPEPATVTLGELYLRQGHMEEAERLFAEVLGRDPKNAAARQGLERVRTHVAAPEVTPPAPEPEPPAREPPMSTFEPPRSSLEPPALALEPPMFALEPLALEPLALAPEFSPAAAAAASSSAPAVLADGGSRRQRTIHLLNSYLERLRRGSQPDVS